MTQIVAARLPTRQAADEAQQALQRQGIAADRIELFDLTDAGRHGRFAVGGDRDADPAAQQSAAGAGKGAAVGVAAGAVVGVAAAAAAAAPLVAPAIIAGVAGAGALAGSLAGAMNATDGRPAPEREASVAGREQAAAEGSTRRGGLMLAVDVGDGSAEAVVLACLRAAGAEDIERADGQWRDGRWIDFDPTQPRRRIDAPGR